MRKPAFCICENNGADQLRGNRRTFGPWLIRTLVNSDLIRTSAVANSDLGQFGPLPIRTSTTGQFGLHKTRSELTNDFLKIGSELAGPIYEET